MTTNWSRSDASGTTITEALTFEDQLIENSDSDFDYDVLVVSKNSTLGNLVQ